MGNIVSLLCPCLGRDKQDKVVGTKVSTPKSEYNDLDKLELATVLRYYMMNAAQR